MKLNVICNAEDRFSCFRVLQSCHVRASMHKITSLELLRHTMLCLVQLSKRRDKATDAEKLLSQWEKVGLCNYKSKTQVHENVSFSWNEMLFAMQKTDFHVLELFCRVVMLELQCTKSLV